MPSLGENVYFLPFLIGFVLRLGGLQCQSPNTPCRVRKDHGPQNFATMRNACHNVLKRERSLKVNKHGKLLRAGWREDYMLEVSHS